MSLAGFSMIQYDFLIICLWLTFCKCSVVFVVCSEFWRLRCSTIWFVLHCLCRRCVWSSWTLRHRGRQTTGKVSQNNDDDDDNIYCNICSTAALRWRRPSRRQCQTRPDAAMSRVLNWAPTANGTLAWPSFAAKGQSHRSSPSLRFCRVSFAEHCSPLTVSLVGVAW